MTTFAYSKYTYLESAGCHSGKDVFRPVVYVILEHIGAFSTAVESLIDTGADYCLFPLDFLGELGIEKDGLGIDYSLGLAEGHPIYFASVTLHIMNLESRKILAGFTEYLNGKGAAFLGNLGFFDQYRVTFDRANLSFKVTPARLVDEGGVKMLAASNDGDYLRMSETLDRSTRIEIRPRKLAFRRLSVDAQFALETILCGTDRCGRDDGFDQTGSHVIDEAGEEPCGRQCGNGAQRVYVDGHRFTRIEYSFRGQSIFADLEIVR
jgi:hypothetical protein